MFSPPRDTAMLMDSPAKPLARPVAKEANGPQSQVHAGNIRWLMSPTRMRLMYEQGLTEAEAAHRVAYAEIASVYDAAIRLVNAEPSVPIPVAEKLPLSPYEQYLHDSHNPNWRPERG